MRRAQSSVRLLAAATGERAGLALREMPAGTEDHTGSELCTADPRAMREVGALTFSAT